MFRKQKLTIEVKNKSNDKKMDFEAINADFEEHKKEMKKELGRKIDHEPKIFTDPWNVYKQQVTEGIKILPKYLQDMFDEPITNPSYFKTV